ncbi:hypothetical protein [Blastococcus sp. TF02A-35]|uniref:hypothetical protein n=1 Tax=Blastococcus sp. TF02A-35 TaxID=2559612 RepID=UPI001074997A|nr:hypothetical protein [Blastococcus sp. TF02A_35]TFV51798.1 hypothetical protein E4P43_08970 [Blastococcus sp. TF02A_35]
MAADLPGWCEHCGAELLHAERRPGRARRFCGDACRQAFNRQVRLRRDLMREVGLSVVQVERLLARFRVSARFATAAEKRDLTPSRSDRVAAGAAPSERGSGTSG